MEEQAKALYPLSHPQKRIWYNEKIHPGTSAHNIGGIAFCEGALDLGRLEQALLMVLRKHEALRLRLTEREGEALQYVQEEVPASLPRLDVSGADDPFARLETITDEMFRTPMTLLDAPLYEIVLVRLGEQRHAFILKLHHIIADGWSVHIFSEQVAHFYGRLTEGEEIAVEADGSYLEALAREEQYAASARFERDKAFWKERLVGYNDAYRGTDAEDTTGKRMSFRLEEALSHRVQSFAAEQRLTVNALFTALVLIDLHKGARQDDLLLGLPVFNRSGAKEKSTFGMYTSTMPYRTQVDPEQRADELFQRVQTELTKCLHHQKYPYDLLVRDVQDAQGSGEALFHVCVNYYNTKLKLRYGEATVENLEWYSGHQFYALQVTIKEWASNGQVELQFDYKTSVYADEQMEQLYQRLCRLLEQVLEQPGARVCELRVLGDAERERLLYGFNDTDAIYPKDKVIHELFAEQVARTPDAPAIYCQGETVTYRELQERTDRLARSLRRMGVQRGTVVGLYAKHAPETVMAILAVLKADGAYLPIDPGTPSDRIGFMLTDSGAHLLLTDEGLPEGTSFAGQAVRLADLSLNEEPSGEWVPTAGPDDLAYVIYTSGSTGKPKGTMIEHRGLVNYAWWASRAYLPDEDDVFALYSSLAFDLTVTSIFAPLVSGRAMAIYQEQPGEFVLHRILQERVANVIKLTPAHLSLLVGGDGYRGAVRRFILGGEDLKTSLSLQAEQTFGDELEVLNEYGPTETVVGCMIHRYERNQDTGASVPIGRPIDNVQIYVLDPHLEPVAPGAPGEIFIGGDGVARGYLNRPELNEERFLPNPFRAGGRMYRTGDLARHNADGIIEYLGRMDDQVKIRGYRIERGEIEQQLIAQEEVREAVVIDRTESDGTRYLAAYVVLERDVTAFELRGRLSAVLPSYMVPSCFVQMESLPLTQNGKVDRRRLPDPSEGQMGSEAVVRDEQVEALLIEVLQEVLQTDGLTPEDNFYQVGGDSIKAIQAVSKLSEAGCRLTVKDLLAYPVIREMAALVRMKQEESAPQTAAVGAVGRTPISEWFRSRNFANPHHFNQSVLLKLTERLDADRLQAAVQGLVVHHDSLRLQLDAETGSLVYQEALLKAPSHVEHHDLTAWAAEEQAQRLCEIASAVKGSLHLEQGPLFKAVLFDLCPEEQRLLFTAHHLLVDGVSWQILLADFERLLQGKSPAPKTHSMQAFAERLDAYGQQLGTEAERYWQQVIERIEPLDVPEWRSEAEGVVQVTRSLEPEETERLLTTAHAPYGTQTQELLLAALAMACQEIAGAGKVTVELEGHGREPLFEDIEVSRTVGWFTTMYPLTLELPNDGLSSQLKAVKEQVRAVPNKGFDYGVLTRLAKRLPPCEEKLVRFNYLGELDAAISKGLFLPAAEATGAESAEENGLTCLLEAVLMVVDKRLQITMTSRSAQSVERFADCYLQAVRTVLAHCTAKEEVEFTPSDFSTAELSQDELDDLFV